MSHNITVNSRGICMSQSLASCDDEMLLPISGNNDKSHNNIHKEEMLKTGIGCSDSGLVIDSVDNSDANSIASDGNHSKQVANKKCTRSCEPFHSEWSQSDLISNHSTKNMYGESSGDNMQGKPVSLLPSHEPNSVEEAVPNISESKETVSSVIGQHLELLQAVAKMNADEYLAFLKQTAGVNSSIDLGDQLFSCFLCTESYNELATLLTHMQTHYEEIPYKCNICKKSLPNVAEFTKHMKTHKVKKPYLCTVCNRSFKHPSLLSRHARLHTGEKPFACCVCSKSFSQTGGLAHHMRTHTGEKPYRCTVCQKAFSQSASLSTHMRIHTGEKPFSCTVCGRSFTQSPDLNRHMVTHSGQKPFSCSICNESFSLSYNLYKHMKIHIEGKKFACTMCDKAFGQPAHLTQHLRTHTGEKPYTCSVCNKSFNLSGHLNRHMRIHTGERPFTCSICTKAFHWSDDLARHMKIHLRDNPDCETFPVPLHPQTVAAQIEQLQAKIQKIHADPSAAAVRLKSGDQAEAMDAAMVEDTKPIDCDEMKTEVDTIEMEATDATHIELTLPPVADMKSPSCRDQIDTKDLSGSQSNSSADSNSSGVTMPSDSDMQSCYGATLVS